MLEYQKENFSEVSPLQLFFKGLGAEQRVIG
jgi:hypothetical protein